MVTAAAGTGAARAGRYGVLAGGLLYAAGNLLQLGGHLAVAELAGHGNPADTANEIAFTVDRMNEAYEIAGAWVLAAALLVIAAGPAQRPTVISASSAS